MPASPTTKPDTGMAQERVAHALCELMDDEWRLGRKLYMSKADEILSAIAYSELLAALQKQNEFEGLLEAGNDVAAMLAHADAKSMRAAAIAKATGAKP